MTGTSAASWLLLLTLPAASPGGEGLDWPMSRRDASNQAAVQLETGEPATPRAWTFALDRHVWGFQPGMTVFSSPALSVVDGKAVVAFGAYDNNIYLRSAVDGVERWRFTTGAGVYSAPIFWHDGDLPRLYAASSDRLVYCLDGRTGARLWSTAVEGYLPTVEGARLSSPCLGKAKDRPAVFVGHWFHDRSLAHSKQQGALSALDARDGKLLWRRDFLDNRVNAPIYAELRSENRIFVSSEDGNLRALAADSGEQRWFLRETEPMMGVPTLVPDPAGPRIVIGSHFGKLRCLDAETGSEIWSLKTGNWLTGAAALSGSGATQRLTFGSYDQKVYHLDAKTGQRLWTQTTAGPVYSSPALIQGERALLVIHSLDHFLYGLNERDGTVAFALHTGAPLWSGVVQGESNWSSPATARINGRWMIYFGSYAGIFHAIPEADAELMGPSAPWTNESFFWILGFTLAATLLLALFFTRRSRKPEHTPL